MAAGGRIRKRLRAQGFPARDAEVEDVGAKRAERAVNMLGPYLLPLISRVEVRLSGARTIDQKLMPKEWSIFRNLDRYELVGIVDVVSRVELGNSAEDNPLVLAVRNAVKRNLPAEFEIIVDYKGMRRPTKKRQHGRLDLATYEWQLQNYANLRERQREGPEVVAGLLLFLNELYPTKDDIQKWKSETEDHTIDIPFDSQWRQPSDIPDEEKLKRAIYITAVTAESQPELYTQAADQERLAESAMYLLDMKDRN
jgi:hypothetical protein